MTAPHALRALRALLAREMLRFVQQRGRFFAALVRPLLWLLIFGAGFRAAIPGVPSSGRYRGRV